MVFYAYVPWGFCASCTKQNNIYFCFHFEHLFLNILFHNIFKSNVALENEKNNKIIENANVVDAGMRASR